MDTSVMKMCGYNFQQLAVMTKEYGDEVMCSGWNPQLAQANEYFAAQINEQVSLFAGMVKADVEALQKLLYEFQR